MNSHRIDEILTNMYPRVFKDLAEATAFAQEQQGYIIELVEAINKRDKEFTHYFNLWWTCKKLQETLAGQLDKLDDFYGVEK